MAEVCEARISNIFFIFSQAESHVKEMVAERTVLHRKYSPLTQVNIYLADVDASLRCIERIEENVTHSSDNDAQIYKKPLHAVHNS